MAMASCLSSFLSYFLFSALLLSSCNPTCDCSHHSPGGDAQSHHVVNVQTLLPSDTCSSSKGWNHTGLKVVHRHGPCSPTKTRRGTPNPTPAQLLLLDESRAESLRRRRRRSPAAAEPQRAVHAEGPRGSMATSSIPARRGSALGTGNYVVTVGLGTPQRALSVVFDTGSDLTWVQCRPCVGSCYQQEEPLFDPGESSSYQNITCGAAECSAIESATGRAPGCSASGCLYGIQYGDNSYSVGFFARETLTLTPSDVFPGFHFGCGQKNAGLFGEAAGLLGLGRDQVSVVSQASGKYGRVFSYCLPSTSSSTGYLTMGAAGGDATTSGAVKFTPMLTDRNLQSFYFLDMVGISVGGRQLQVPATVFQLAGTLIDSGTVISRLPPAAYAALRSAFRRLMGKYPAAPALSILDTCYDLSNYETVALPKVALLFRGGAPLDVDVSGILYVASVSQACLAFAGNGDAGDVAIVGNMQQKRYRVVYDGSKEVIGFGAGGCT